MAVALPNGLELNLLRNGSRISPPKSMIQSDMEDGVKTRALARGAPETFEGEFRFPDADYQTFKNWVAVDLGGGALRFDWDHPLTGAAVEAELVARDQRPFEVSRVSGFNIYVRAAIRVFS